MELRRRLKEKLNPVGSKYAGVFIARGNLGAKRCLTNESEVIEHLSKRGFDIVFPEKMTVAEIQTRLWDAPIVINVEGSAHMHASHSMSLNGALLHLQPPYRFVDIDKGVFDSTGRIYGFYVCLPSENKDNFYLDNFSNLDKLIDIMRNACAIKRGIN
jgi:capsular polysaccharide biosynthesis protein